MIGHEAYSAMTPPPPPHLCLYILCACICKEEGQSHYTNKHVKCINNSYNDAWAHVHAMHLVICNCTKIALSCPIDKQKRNSMMKLITAQLRLIVYAMAGVYISFVI